MTGTISKAVTLFIFAGVSAMQGQTSACDPTDLLDQGWDCQTQYKFWYTPQGSWIIPYQWLSALQIAKNGKVVRFASLLTSEYGYIDAPPDVPQVLNPGKLPIGFVKDGTAAKPYLGMTCAACHTARMVLGGRPVLVNGAPSNGDFYAFLSDLVTALKQTQSDRFDTFAQDVGGNPGQLKLDLATELNSLQDRDARNLPPQPYGRGRVDAFGHIFNQVVISSRRPWPAIAPVSYPALWRTPRMDVVQWNGSASNSGQGPFLRNIGEALGVFGRIWVNIGDSGYGIKSTIRPLDIKNLELWVASLRPPKLPDSYYPDKATVDAGRLLYKQRCAACHAIMDRKDLTTPITAQMFRTGSAAEERDGSEKIIATESLMAEEFLDRKNDLGTLRISPQLPIWSLPVRVVNTFLPSVLTQEELPLAGQMILGSAIVNAALGVMTEDDALEVLKHPVRNSSGVLQEITQTVPQYKAGPLNGVWATAPYLHNGSVASLDALLNPAQRLPFCLSGREFDSAVVGFKKDPACTSTIDTTKEGNRNVGHDFGSGLQPSEKRALIEFLKSL